MARSDTPQLLRKVTLSFAFALLMLTTIAFLSYRSIRSLGATTDRLTEARAVLEKIDSLACSLTSAECVARGFALTHEQEHLRRFDGSQKRIAMDFAALKVQLAGQPEQAARLGELQPLVDSQLARLKKGIEAASKGTASASLFQAQAGRREQDEIGGLLADISAFERENLRAVSSLSHRLGRMAGVAITLGGLLALGLLLWAGQFVLRDISARQRTEEALESERNLLRRVIDSIPEQVSVRDAEGRCIVENAARRRLLPPVPLDGAEGAEPHTPDEADEDRQIIEAGRPVLKELPVRGTDGRTRWLSIKKVPFKDREGKIVGTVSLASDISAHKEAEETLHLTASQLRTSNAELQEFASVASHDLQEPLRKILAFGGRLHTKCHDALGEDGRDYLARITNATQRMQSLVEGLLTLARVSQREVHFVRVDLQQVIREVLTDLEIRIEQSGARMEVGELPVVEADALQMRQLFQNLIANALKFQKPGAAPLVKIHAARTEPEDALAAGFPSGEEAWQIAVEDNGIGFEEKFAGRIFDPFLRLHGRNAYEGAGIGLSVVRKIVDRHRGTIRACGSEGRGAKFIVTLPAKQPNKEPHE
jgi:PAS domain S-box-containing protein